MVKEGGGGGGAVSKKIFSALRASVWSKNKEGDRGPSPGSATDVNILSLLNEPNLNSRKSTLFSFAIYAHYVLRY